MVRKLRPSFNKAFLRRFFVRFHMGLILFAVAASGFLFDLTLLGLGVTAPAWRYLLSSFFAYATLFGFVRLWLAYIYPSSKTGGRLDFVDWIQMDFSEASRATSSGTKAADAASSVFKGGGGRSGGGGASADWSHTAHAMETKAQSASLGVGEAPGLGAAVESGAASAEGIGSAAAETAAAGLEALPVIGLIAFVAMIIAVLGSAAYLIVDAPAVLAEAALQMGLSLGLIRLKRKRLQGNWAKAVARFSWKPFVFTSSMLLILGIAMQSYFPAASTLSEALKEAGWISPD
ncbi:MAG TPA: hypothetical protein VJB59_06345 [Bdellovibrionota bacterium]|nr:hypothetical protein [Bdellovibrionota bacterium]